jgi:hypothetical protein
MVWTELDAEEVAVGVPEEDVGLPELGKLYCAKANGIRPERARSASILTLRGKGESEKLVSEARFVGQSKS